MKLLPCFFVLLGPSCAIFTEEKCLEGGKMAFWNSFPSLGADDVHGNAIRTWSALKGCTSFRVHHVFLQFISWGLRRAEINWDCSDSHLGQNSHGLQHRLRLLVPMSFSLLFIPQKGKRKNKVKEVKKHLPVADKLKAIGTHRYRGCPQWKKSDSTSDTLFWKTELKYFCCAMWKHKNPRCTLETQQSGV